MTPERMAGLVAAWARLYTRGLPATLAEPRIAELESDLHDQIEHDRAQGVGERPIARSIASRMVRGLPADASWRAAQAVAITEHVPPEEARRLGRVAYRRAFAVALGSMLVLFWLIGALGLIGTSGDRADLLYLGVFATGVVGAVVARLRGLGMARTLAVMAVVQAGVAVFALARGLVPAYNSPFEIVALNAFFVVLFAGAAWLFNLAALRRA